MPSPALRHVAAHLSCTVHDPASMELQIAVSRPAEERLAVTLDGEPVELAEHLSDHGGRLHLLAVGPGQLEIDYRASVGDPVAPTTGPLDASRYLRPSRYAESDRLLATGLAEFGGLTDPAELLPAVAQWVGTRLVYVPGSSSGTDGAVDTLLARRGVCRDYAHLAVALLRSRDVPARLASVYAPGLDPMDFHAVVEALVDGVWRVVDATLLAPRPSLVRVATGRDAADTAFLSSWGGLVELSSMEVQATVDGDLPVDDLDEPVSLGA